MGRLLFLHGVEEYVRVQINQKQSVWGAYDLVRVGKATAARSDVDKGVVTGNASLSDM